MRFLSRSRKGAALGALVTLLMMLGSVGAFAQGGGSAAGYSVEFVSFASNPISTTFTWKLVSATNTDPASHVLIQTCLGNPTGTTSNGTAGIATYGPDGSLPNSPTGWKWNAPAVGATMTLTFLGQWSDGGTANWWVKKGNNPDHTTGVTGGPSCQQQTPTGTIKIEKNVTGQGADTSQDFSFTDDIPNVTVGNLSDDDGEQTYNSVPVGTYNVTEDLPLPSARWSFTSVTCTETNGDNGSAGNNSTRTGVIDLDDGETVKCTFVNHDPGPPPPPPPPGGGTLVVEKQTLPDGSTEDFEFTSAILTTPETLSDGENFSRGVAAGSTTTVTEGALAGWELTGITCDDTDSTVDLAAGTATFRVASGETVKCTFTNTQDGSITVTKDVVSLTDEGAAATFAFAGDVSGTLGNGQSASADVAPGTYTTTETVPDGWDLTIVDCDDLNSTGDPSTATATFNVEPGEDVECTFTNVEEEVLGNPPTPPPPTPPVIDEDPPVEEDEVLPKRIQREVLPFTGIDASTFVTLAGLLMAGGGGLVLTARRRRR
ncbi:MAG: prealbumin-like fold domain-containing protein [Actinomycetota bacterium]